MKNYDTVDATPLLLIAIYKYYTATGDEEFLRQVMSSVDAALGWILEYGDENDDGFVDYEFSPNRKFGGLATQNWMDSKETLFNSIIYPIAPVEVQAYVYLAFRQWAHYFADKQPERAIMLENKARRLKLLFNKKFVVNGDDFILASAIDGRGRRCSVARSIMGHCLWAAWKHDNAFECVLNKQYVPLLVKRLMKPDLFEPKAGIRTLSSSSHFFDAKSYHNGSIWPHDTSMVAEGLENFGYTQQAKLLTDALMVAYAHFQMPIELFVYDGDYQEYQSACKKQAWSAAALLLAAESLPSMPALQLDKGNPA